MITIDARCAIFNLASKIDRISRDDLSRFASEISKLDHCIYVDICDKSVMGVVEDYSHMMEWDNEEIVIQRIGDWSKDFINKTFNASFSDEMKQDLAKCVDLIAQRKEVKMTCNCGVTCNCESEQEECCKEECCKEECCKETTFQKYWKFFFTSDLCAYGLFAGCLVVGGLILGGLYLLGLS
jgi:hypothetical protein